ncbi:MAG: Ldh family oxidoreductase [Candidatus Rokubacteria bacterium]|nr:Ldh family oxidoreductase [Candidatus Rokubacteria bacterium]
MPRVGPESLRALIAGVFAAMGAPGDDADTVAEVLVEADLRGVESHGSTRVAGYVSMIRLGLLNPTPKVEILRDLPSIAMLEGDRAFGIVVAKRAMRMAMDKAGRAGIACVTVRNVTHTGMIGFYPMMAARGGLIGLAMNNGPKILPPFGGRTPTLATNPFAAAFPADREDPIVLDMATSVVAGGKLRLAAKKGVPIPLEWALDRHGVPTTDPEEAIFHGFLQWAGGYKGFGIATVVEALSGVLSGGLFGTDVSAMKAFGREPLVTSAFYLAIDPEHFMPRQEFRQRIDRLVRQIKASERAAGVEAVFVAGEIEFRRRAERARDGIPLSDVVYEELRTVARETGVEFHLA